MKTLFLFGVLFVCFHSMHGQGGDGQYLQKCLINPKTGDTIRQTFWISVDVSTKYLLNMRLTRVNSTYKMELRYHFGKSPQFFIIKGDSVWIKYVGGLRVSLFALDSMKSKRGGAWIPESPDGLVTQGVSITYDLPSKFLFAFLGNEIEKIRIYSSKGAFDINWPASKKDLVINCLRAMTEPRKNFKIAEPDPDISHESIPQKEKPKEDNF